MIRITFPARPLAARVFCAFAVFLVVVSIGSTPGASAAGTFAKSLELNGSNHLTTPDADDLTLGGSFTFEAWIRSFGPPTTMTILSKDYTSSYWFGLSDFGTGTNQWLLLQANNSGGTASSAVIPLGTWTHVAVTWRIGVETRFYINGKLDSVRAAVPGPLDNSKPLLIGSSPSPLSRNWRGNLAEVRIWNTVRTQNEIQSSMLTALQEKLPNLVASWSLADDFGDSTGAHPMTGVNSAALQGPAAPPRPAVIQIDTDVIKDYSQPSVGIFAAATATSPKRLLLIGGNNTSASPPLRNDIQSVDSGTGKVTTLPNKLPEARYYAAAAYAPGKDLVYSFGGLTALLNFVSDGKILAINPTTGETRIVAGSVPAFGAVAVYHAPTGKIWIFGGQQSVGGTVGSAPAVWIFDPATETLTTASFTFATAGPSGQISNYSAAASSNTGKIYIVGDPIASRAIIEMTVNGDGSGSTRTMNAQLSAANSGEQIVEDPKSGQLYVIGGVANRVIDFDPVLDQVWETPILLPISRSFPGVVYDPGGRHLLVVGGVEGIGGAKNTIWQIKIGDGPSVPVGMWDFPDSVGSAINDIHGSAMTHP